jgi:heptosyltransferase-2
MVIRGSNWLGDAVMSVPAVRAIKRGRPDAHVTILTPAKLADFWRTVAEVDAVIAIEPRETVFAVARKLRAGNFEAAIVLPNSLRTALEPWLAGVPRRIGFAGHRRAWLLNQIPRDKKSKNKGAAAPRHQVHHYLQLAAFIGADVSLAEKTVNDDSQIVHREIALPRSPRRIGLCPGAEYGPAKRWLPERFAETMRVIYERTHCEWCIFGVANDRGITDEIVQLAAIPVTDLVGKTTLAELIDRLRECDLLVTNDTGTMHLAAYLGVPVVAIFGSTEPSLTGPLNLGEDATGEAHTILRRHVECSPCFLRECPIDFRCMKAIASTDVIAAIEQHLRSHPTLR